MGSPTDLGQAGAITNTAADLTSAAPSVFLNNARTTPEVASEEEQQRTVVILMVMWMVREGGIALRLATEYVRCTRLRG